MRYSRPDPSAGQVIQPLSDSALISTWRTLAFCAASKEE